MITKAHWTTVADPETYVRQVLVREADDIPAALIDVLPWRQQYDLSLVDLSVDEEMVSRHDRTPLHLRRRDGFIERISAGESLPPLIALGADRFLVDGYARIRALRRLGIAAASVLVQLT
jgi:hypothetical protein